MTPEAQRIAIAEACGWKPNPFERDMRGQMFPQSPPDYPNDLNAMHEAEKMLNRGNNYYQLGGFGLYLKILGQICHQASSVDASAAQRAEAFLCAIGKWEAGQ